MVNRLLVLVFIVSLVVCCDIRAYAASSPVFGPKRFARERGAPAPVDESIKVCAPSGEYRLVVENGDAAGGSRISSGSITLNGAQVVKQNEFNQNIGRIEKPLSLKTDNVLSVSLASGPAAYIDVSVVCVSGCLDVTMTAPSTGAAINNTNALVKGAVYNSGGEAGVVVTTSAAGAAGGEASTLAQVHDGNFAALALLAAGANTLTAVATDACGYKAWDTITIEAVPGPYVAASAVPESGVVSQSGAFSATLSADVRIDAAVADYAWDIDGDGTIDASGKDLSSMEANYTQNLLYFPRVVVTDAAGNQYSGTTVVNVVSQAYIDALLKGKWNGMKGALASGDVETATGYFSERTRDMYRYNFKLMSGVLPKMVTDIGNITFVGLSGETAEYDMTAVQDGNTYSFYLTFARDKDGIWRIKSF